MACTALHRWFRLKVGAFLNSLVVVTVALGISCLRARGGGFPIAPATPSVRSLMNLCRIQRWQVAATLSAAVTTPKPIGDYTKLTGGTNSEESRTPNASYSSGGGPGEGLLLEKPPPPEFLSSRSLFGREREGGASLREAAFPEDTAPAEIYTSVTK